MDGFLLLISLLLGGIGSLWLVLAWPEGWQQRWPELTLGAVALLVAGMAAAASVSLERERDRLALLKVVPLIEFTK